MKTVKTITQEQVKECGFEPEPHTVSLHEINGKWWALTDDKNILSIVCVSNKHGGKYYSQVFTPKEKRNNGYSTLLISALANQVYNGHYQIAHCLKASVNVFKKAGFHQFKHRHFKHGDQYYMERFGIGDGKTKNRN